MTINDRILWYFNYEYNYKGLHVFIQCTTGYIKHIKPT